MAEIRGMGWVDGEFVVARDLTISVFDSGLVGRVAVFDTLAY